MEPTINGHTKKEAIELAFPHIQRANIHVWTLGGKSRVPRIGTLWQTWRALGVHVVEDGWTLPTGLCAFTDSGKTCSRYSGCSRQYSSKISQDGMLTTRALMPSDSSFS